jgi:hypothetical protein
MVPGSGRLAEPQGAKMTETNKPTLTDESERPAQLVDRVRVEMARRRALAEALRPPKPRPASSRFKRQ